VIAVAVDAANGEYTGIGRGKRDSLATRRIADRCHDDDVLSKSIADALQDGVIVSPTTSYADYLCAVVHGPGDSLAELARVSQITALCQDRQDRGLWRYSKDSVFVVDAMTATSDKTSHGGAVSNAVATFIAEIADYGAPDHGTSQVLVSNIDSSVG
jgi:hypothetical protein